MFTRAMRSTVTATLLMLSTSLYALPPIYKFQAGLGGTDVGPGTDEFYYLTGAMLYSNEVSKKAIVDLQAEISSWDYSDNNNLDSEELFLQASYAFTPRAGFRVPTYSLALRHLEEFMSDDDMDASTTTLILSVAYRPGDRASLLGGLKLGERDAGGTSDVESLFVNYDYRLSPQWLLYTTLESGEGAANARSYCSGAYGSIGSRWNWRWDAAADDCDFTTLTLGASFVFNAFNNLDMSVSHQEYDLGPGDIDGNVYSVDFFHRF